MSTDTHLHCTVANCQCPFHAAAIACAQAGTKKQDPNGTMHAMSASERRTANALSGHEFEKLVRILRKAEPKDQKGIHALAMHSILVRYPGQDIEVMVRARSLCGDRHEKVALGLAICFVNLKREFGEPFHADSLLPKQSH